VPLLLMLAGGIALLASTAALWLQRRRWSDRRFFAGLVATAVTLSLFSVVIWAATLIASIAPLALIWALVAVLALLFAVRLYRELLLPPSN
jgi:cobalamin biosynthesis protein CobD/CbiB